MNNQDDIKEKVIPKVSAEQFTFDKWNAGFCQNFYDFDYEYIKSCIIGWCKASRVSCRKRYDEDFIAIYLNDDTWCHLPTWAIKDFKNDRRDFWKLEGYEHIDNE